MERRLGRDEDGEEGEGGREAGLQVRAQAAPVFQSVLMTQMCCCREMTALGTANHRPLAAPPLDRVRWGGKSWREKKERGRVRET